MVSSFPSFAIVIIVVVATVILLLLAVKALSIHFRYVQEWLLYAAEPASNEEEITVTQWRRRRRRRKTAERSHCTHEDTQHCGAADAVPLNPRQFPPPRGVSNSNISPLTPPSAVLERPSTTRAGGREAVIFEPIEREEESDRLDDDDDNLFSAYEKVENAKQIVVSAFPNQTRYDCPYPSPAQGFHHYEILSIPTRDGITLRGYVVRPAAVSDASRQRAAAEELELRQNLLHLSQTEQGEPHQRQTKKKIINGGGIPPRPRAAPDTSDTEKGVIVYFHGNAGNVGHRLPIAFYLAKATGCAVVMVDYRGYGKSDDPPTGFSKWGFQYNKKTTSSAVEGRMDNSDERSGGGGGGEEEEEEMLQQDPATNDDESSTRRNGNARNNSEQQRPPHAPTLRFPTQPHHHEQYNFSQTKYVDPKEDPKLLFHALIKKLEKDDDDRHQLMDDYEVYQQQSAFFEKLYHKAEKMFLSNNNSVKGSERNRNSNANKNSDNSNKGASHRSHGNKSETHHVEMTENENSNPRNPSGRTRESHGQHFRHSTNLPTPPTHPPHTASLALPFSTLAESRERGITSDGIRIDAEAIMDYVMNRDVSHYCCCCENHQSSGGQNYSFENENESRNADRCGDESRQREEGTPPCSSGFPHPRNKVFVMGSSLGGAVAAYIATHPSYSKHAFMREEVARLKKDVVGTLGGGKYNDDEEKEEERKNKNRNTRQQQRHAQREHDNEPANVIITAPALAANAHSSTTGMLDEANNDDDDDDDDVQGERDDDEAMMMFSAATVNNSSTTNHLAVSCSSSSPSFSYSSDYIGALILENTFSSLAEVMVPTARHKLTNDFHVRNALSRLSHSCCCCCCCEGLAAALRKGAVFIISQFVIFVVWVVKVLCLSVDDWQTGQLLASEAKKWDDLYSEYMALLSTTTARAALLTPAAHQQQRKKNSTMTATASGGNIANPTDPSVVAPASAAEEETVVAMTAVGVGVAYLTPPRSNNNHHQSGGGGGAPTANDGNDDDSNNGNRFGEEFSPIGDHNIETCPSSSSQQIRQQEEVDANTGNGVDGGNAIVSGGGRDGNGEKNDSSSATAADESNADAESVFAQFARQLQRSDQQHHLDAHENDNNYDDDGGEGMGNNYHQHQHRGDEARREREGDPLSLGANGDEHIECGGGRRASEVAAAEGLHRSTNNNLLLSSSSGSPSTIRRGVSGSHLDPSSSSLFLQGTTTSSSSASASAAASNNISFSLPLLFLSSEHDLLFPHTHMRDLFCTATGGIVSKRKDKSSPASGGNDEQHRRGMRAPPRHSSGEYEFTEIKNSGAKSTSSSSTTNSGNGSDSGEKMVYTMAYPNSSIRVTKVIAGTHHHHSHSHHALASSSSASVSAPDTSSTLAASSRTHNNMNNTHGGSRVIGDDHHNHHHRGSPLITKNVNNECRNMFVSFPNAGHSPMTMVQSSGGKPYFKVIHQFISNVNR